MGTIRLTRQEIEMKLSREYLGKIVIYTLANKREVCGKIGRITCESHTGEAMAIFAINHVRYECDVNYFIENTKLCTKPINGGMSGTPSG